MMRDVIVVRHLLNLRHDDRHLEAGDAGTGSEGPAGYGIHGGFEGSDREEGSGIKTQFHVSDPVRRLPLLIWFLLLGERLFSLLHVMLNCSV